MLQKRECTCEKCIEACQRNPGWFGTIREIEGAAKIMGVSVQNFAKEYLIREWWTFKDGDIIVPAPRRNFSKKDVDCIQKAWEEEIQENGQGFVRASWGHNLMRSWACIFLDENDRCLIHQSKPKECRETFCCGSDNFKGRGKLALYWKKHKDYIDFLQY